MIDVYNEALAEDIERLERMLNETGDGQDESSLTLDLAGLVENVQGAARELVGYMVDMAKADALDLIGETRLAFELVDRHIRTVRAEDHGSDSYMSQFLCPAAAAALR